MLTTIEYQGYTIKAPDGPSEQGSFTAHPTPTQIVSQVDQQLVYTEPVSYETVMGQKPANELVPGTVTFQCYWDTIANVVAQDAQANKSVQYTTGITTTDSETKKFSMTFGLDGPVLEVLKATLSATFSSEETHSVSLTETRSVTESYTTLPGTTLQVWQLHAEYIAEFEKDGKTYRYTLAQAGSSDDGCVLMLTYPETPAAS
jgi:hypothetical protein